MTKYKIGIIVTLFAMNNAFATSENFYVNAGVGISKSEKIKSDQTFYKQSGNSRFNSNAIYSLGFGYKINDKLRTELLYSFTDLEYSIHKDNIATNKVVPVDFYQKVKVKTGMVNLYYDMLGKRNITPYLGFGFGFSNVIPDNANLTTARGTTEYYSKKSNNFTYSLMGGISIKMNEKVNLDIGYKYQNFGKSKGLDSYKNLSREIKPENPKKFKIKTHSATVGVRFNF